MVSQVFRGDKHLSLELALSLSEYLQMSDEESDYFLLLVEFNRASSFKLKKRFEKQVRAIQALSLKLERQVKNNAEMSDQVRTVFYSSWIYSGTRMLVDIDGMSDVDALSRRLNLPKNQILKVVEFLLQNNLLKLQGDKLRLGPSRTHVGSSNLYVNRHHQNWRLQAFNKMVQSGDENFFYTGPMALSAEVADWIRQELPAMIEKFNAKIIPSKSETVRCLNIDWFEY